MIVKRSYNKSEVIFLGRLKILTERRLIFQTIFDNMKKKNRQVIAYCYLGVVNERKCNDKEPFKCPFRLSTASVHGLYYSIKEERE